MWSSTNTIAALVVVLLRYACYACYACIACYVQELGATYGVKVRIKYIQFVITGLNVHPVFVRGKCLVEANWSYRVALASF